MVMLGLVRKHSSILGIKPKLAFIRHPSTQNTTQSIAIAPQMTSVRRREHNNHRNTEVVVNAMMMKSITII